MFHVLISLVCLGLVCFLLELIVADIWITMVEKYLSINFNGSFNFWYKFRMHLKFIRNGLLLNWEPEVGKGEKIDTVPRGSDFTLFALRLLPDWRKHTETSGPKPELSALWTAISWTILQFRGSLPPMHEKRNFDAATISFFSWF